MAKTSIKLFITFLFSCLAVHTVHSCSCMPSHPQDQFCRADFVIRAKVVDHRFVYDDEREKDITTVSAQNELTTREVEIAEIDNEIPNEIPLERFKKSIMPLPPLVDVEEEIAGLGPREPLAQAWKVRITKVYKGDESLTKDKVVELYTAPYEGLCGVVLQESVHYVLSGSIYDGKLRISACGLNKVYDRLTSRQKQGFSNGYAKACSVCRIVPCFGSTCRTSEDTCSWLPFGPSPDCESQYSRCIRRKSGECGWHKNKHFKSCVAIRRGD